LIEHLVFLLEGESERDFLELLLPRVLPPNIRPHFMVFEGKQCATQTQALAASQ
jgi:hypothetical protein